MPDVSDPGGSTSTDHPYPRPTAGLDGLKYRTAAEAALEPESPAAYRVGWGFISLYTLAFMSTSLLFIAPLLVTLALKVNSLVGSNGRRTTCLSSPGPPRCCPSSATRSSAS